MSYRFSGILLSLVLTFSGADAVAQEDCDFELYGHVDVTELTGGEVVGPVESWQTQDGPYTVEHLAGRSPNNDLLAFWWSPQADWQVVNVSNISGQKIAGPVTSWQTYVEAYDVNVEHLAGRSPDGDLVVFWWSPRDDWQSVNVSDITGQKIAGPVTSWLTQDGPYTVEHLAGPSPDGSLVTFFWSPRSDWQAIDVSELANGRLEGPPSVYQLAEGGQNAELLAARSPDDHLLLYWWRPAVDWQMIDLTDATGRRSFSAPETWLTTNGANTVEHFAVESDDNHLLVFWGDDTGRSLTESLYEPYGPLHSMRHITRRVLAVLWDPDRPGHPAQPVADVQAAIFGNQGSVRDYYTENSNGFFTIGSALGGTNVLGWYGSRFPHQHYIDHFVKISVYGSGASNDFRLTINYDQRGPKTETVSGSVGQGEWVHYSYKVEGGSQLTVDMVGTGNADLYVRRGERPTFADYDCRPSNAGSAETCTVNGPLESCGFIDGYKEGQSEAISRAAQDIDFSTFDDDGDGTVSAEELAVLVVKPQNNPYGSMRGVLGSQVPSDTPLIVDGVRIPSMVEWYTGSPASVGMGTAAHELSHMLLGSGDAYFNFQNPYAAASYDLMANGNYSDPPSHMNPLEKLKHGWLKPKIIFRNGNFDLADIENNYDVWVLLDPERGTDEFFLLENRSRGNSYDAAMQDEGLAAWHFIADPGAYCAPMFKPANVGTYDANGNGVDDWFDVSCTATSSRASLRMLRSVSATATSGYKVDAQTTMWDGGDASGETAYDLVSIDTDPAHAELRWADRTPSGFSVRSISAASPLMNADIEVPACTPVPEPGRVTMLVAGIGALASLGRRRRSSASLQAADLE